MSAALHMVLEGGNHKNLFRGVIMVSHSSHMLNGLGSASLLAIGLNPPHNTRHRRSGGVRRHCEEGGMLPAA